MLQVIIQATGRAIQHIRNLLVLPKALQEGVGRRVVADLAHEEPYGDRLVPRVYDLLLALDDSVLKRGLMLRVRVSVCDGADEEGSRELFAASEDVVHEGLQDPRAEARPEVRTARGADGAHGRLHLIARAVLGEGGVDEAQVDAEPVGHEARRDARDADDQLRLHDASVVVRHGAAVVAVDDGLVEREAREALDAVRGVEGLVGIVAEVAGLVDEIGDEGVVRCEELSESGIVEIFGDALLELFGRLETAEDGLVCDTDGRLVSGLYTTRFTSLNTDLYVVNDWFRHCIRRP